MAFSRMTAFEYLRRAHQQNRLAHAYLITGPLGSGKELLAADLASLVNGTPAKNVFSAKARDIFVARPESKSRRFAGNNSFPMHCDSTRAKRPAPTQERRREAGQATPTSFP